MLNKMNAKLERLENELTTLISDNPAKGHGGTPYITDNSTGRARIKQREKREERIFSKIAQIKEQKEKIERMENRIYYRNTQTKKSEKFIKDNPIHPALLEYAKTEKITQWKRNPEFFFIKELEKVAFTTVAGQVMISKRFPCKTESDLKVAKRIYEELKKFN